MDELIKALKLGEGATPGVTIWAVLIGSLLSAALNAAAGLVYRKVHSEAGYSQTLAHTFVLIGMVTSVIMAIIGSNIARAFSLVGALSIIRFRTAIKSPLDVAFVFLSIAIGMACGTGFYLIAIVGAGVMLSVVLLLHRVNFASYPERREFLLSARFNLEVDYEAALEPLLGTKFDAYSLAFTETVRQGTLREVVYSVRPKEGVKDQEIVDAVTQVNGNLKVAYRSVRYAIEVP